MNIFCFLLNIKMSEKTLQLNDIILNQKNVTGVKNQLTYFQ